MAVAPFLIEGGNLPQPVRLHGEQLLQAHVLHGHADQTAIAHIEQIDGAFALPYGGQPAVQIQPHHPGVILQPGDQIQRVAFRLEAGAAAVANVTAHGVADGQGAAAQPHRLAALDGHPPQVGGLAVIILAHVRPGENHLTRPEIHLPDAVDVLRYYLSGLAGGKIVQADAGAEVPADLKVAAVIHDHAVLRAYFHALHVEQGRGDGGQGPSGAVEQKQADTGFVDDARTVEPEGIFVKNGKMLPLDGKLLQGLPARFAGQVLQPGLFFQILPGLEHIGAGGQLADDRGVQRHGEDPLRLAAGKGQPVKCGVLLAGSTQRLVRFVPESGEQQRLAAVPYKGIHIALSGQLAQGLSGSVQPQVGIVAVFSLIRPVGDQGGSMAVRGPLQVGHGIEGQKIFQFNSLHGFSLPYAFK